MFTGIVEEVGRTLSVGPSHLVVQAETVLTDLKVGDSIAVNGACLTAVRLQPRGFQADLSPETLRRTNLGNLRPGDGVNLERPLAPTGRLGGHIVQGHVDGAGKVSSIRTEGDSTIIGFTCPRPLMPYIVPKGFIAVDGVSLTVVKKGVSSFTVAVIPYTLAHTVLHQRKRGDRVNLEVDIVAKYVESLFPSTWQSQKIRSGEK